MPTLLGKISIAFAALTFAMPSVYAEPAGDSESGGRKLGWEWAESAKKDALDGISVGFGFGSLMSSGSAQQAVNQDGRREEAAKQEKARKKTVAKESETKTSGESGKGTTASRTGESRSPIRQAAEN